MVEIEIDGRTYTATPGENLLKTCLSLGLDLTYFCWHPALGSVGACRQCAAIQYQNPEDQKGRLVMACMTPVAAGMRVSLQAPQAREFRAGMIELLMSNHPHDCPVCEEGGECHLQDMTEMSGHTFRRYRGKKRTHRNQYLGPFLNHEMNRCIACYRCVRFYRDYCGGDDLNVFAAHNHVYFGRCEDGVLENEFAGNLAEVCPTGVFTDKPFSRHYARKWDLQCAPSICVHCGLGCNTAPGEREGILRRVVNRYHGDINGYFLCDRGRFGYDFVNGDRRARQALVRNQPPLSAKGAANYLAKLTEKAQGIVGIGSPRASLEANFALRELVGEERFYVGMEDGEYARVRLILDILRRAPARAASLREIERADAVLVLGEDVSDTAPRLALSLRQAARHAAYAVADRLKIPRWQDASVRMAAPDARSPVFVASCAATRLDDIAVRTFRGAPEDLARLGNDIARALAQIAEPATERASADAEPPAEAVEIARALLAARRPLIVSGTGCGGEAVLRAAAALISALSAARGGQPTDAHFVVPECNSLGLALLGGKPLSLAFEALENGTADTLLILENDLYRRAPAPRVDRLLEKTARTVALDCLLHRTAENAGLLLPAASFAESEGTFVNSEGRAQRYFAVYPPAGDIRPAWLWLKDAGRFDWRGIDELTAACARAVPALAGIVQAAPGADTRIDGLKIPRQTHRYSGRTALYAHLRIHEPQRPDDPDSALSYSMEGAPDRRPAALNPYVWAPGWNSNQAAHKFQEEIGGALRGGNPGVRLLETSPQPEIFFPEASPPAARPPERGLRLIALHPMFGAEELSLHAPAVAERAPAAYLAVHPEDAAEWGLEAGQAVPIRSGEKTLWLPLRLDAGLARGLAGIPLGLPELPWADLDNRRWTPSDLP